MDTDSELVRFECLLPRMLRTELGFSAARNRRTATAELIIALERYLIAESNVALAAGTSAACQGRNDTSGALPYAERVAGAKAPAIAAAPTPEVPPGSSSPGGASPSEAS